MPLANRQRLGPSYGRRTEMLGASERQDGQRPARSGGRSSAAAVRNFAPAHSVARRGNTPPGLREGPGKAGNPIILDWAGDLDLHYPNDATAWCGLFIAHARDSKEQASSIEEVNVAVRTMDEMTQHNAALVEQTNAAIEQTEGQASELDRIVDIFVIDDSRTVARQPAAQEPRAGVKGLQDRVKQAAKAYISHGNAAVAEDWNEF
jgi:methyl-accepting chemotaxis protein